MLTILCIATYFKGDAFLREARQQGATVILLTSDKLANDAALIRLLQEWKTPAPADVRKANIEAGVDGFFLRLGDSVFDDGNKKDRLTGSSGRAPDIAERRFRLLESASAHEKRTPAELYVPCQLLRAGFPGGKIGLIQQGFSL